MRQQRTIAGHHVVPDYPPTLDIERLGFTANVHEKADRLLAAGSVVRVSADPHRWHVRGDHGDYVVRYDRMFEVTGSVGFLTCTCPYHTHHESLISMCSHALAVLKAARPQGAMT